MEAPSEKYLLVVGGPTASGKTSLAVALAQHFDAPILSADSRQFYREMRIGVARPNEEELAQAKHYFIADRSVQQPLSAGTYATEAQALLSDLFSRHSVVIVAGGSGLYLKALTEGLDDFPAVPDNVQQAVQALYDDLGLEALQKALAQEDPEYYAVVDRQNPARLLRALAVCRAAGQPYSSFRKNTGSLATALFTPIYLLPEWDRTTLYGRIDQRVLNMVNDGLENEARTLYEHRHLKALQTVGYQEWFPYFEGEYPLDRAIELIQQNSRRYAKRQLTWFRRDGYWHPVEEGKVDIALALLLITMR